MGDALRRASGATALDEGGELGTCLVLTIEEVSAEDGHLTGGFQHFHTYTFLPIACGVPG